ncbi:putative nuclease HARBI1 [Ixodes scapularis]
MRSRMYDVEERRALLAGSRNNMALSNWPRMGGQHRLERVHSWTPAEAVPTPRLTLPTVTITIIGQEQLLFFFFSPTKKPNVIGKTLKERARLSGSTRRKRCTETSVSLLGLRSASSQQFRRNFRLQREPAYAVIERYERSVYYRGSIHGGSNPKTAEVCILSFLWYAGNKTCIRDVAGRFDMGESTLSRILNRVAEFLCSIAPDEIRFPDDVAALAKDFEEVSGFPGVVGCVDGSYIGIRCPDNKVKSTYVNRHDKTSLTLQGICDHRRRFVDVFTGPPSKIHDSRIYKLSFVSRIIPFLCCMGKYHLLGDAAYPLRETLVTPFRDYGTLTNQQKSFNTKLSSTRVLIENAFGLLKQLFRQLINLEFPTVRRMSTFIIVCCVLHNLCIDAGDTEIRDVEVEELRRQELLRVDSRGSPEEDLPGVSLSDAALRVLGRIKRDRLVSSLFPTG